MSWWLLPAEPDARVLARTIDALAARLGVPTFAPHVTLASGPAEALEAVGARVREERAFGLDVTGVETRSDLARTLALRFAGQELVAELSRRIHPGAAPEGRAPAHLSLVYAPLDADARAELLRATPPPLTHVRFDAIAAVRMFAGELVLADVPQWRELARLPLLG